MPWGKRSPGLDDAQQKRAHALRAEGLTNKLIAKRLGVGASTVDRLFRGIGPYVAAPTR